LKFVVTIEMLLWFPVSTAKPVADTDKSVEVCLCFISYPGLTVEGSLGFMISGPIQC